MGKNFKINLLFNVEYLLKKIIEFLSQIENFQKKLWLKKKFVFETNYCVTLDRVPEEMYQEILNNTDQIKEWKNLFDVDENAVNKDFLLQNPFLVLDTAFFSSEFKEKLIESIDNLDETLDGLLIHSENFQALNLLQERYREQIKCVYIDPPYNTGNDGFIYKDGYSHSSWMSMMKDRLLVARESMSEDGVIFISIDDNEQAQLKMLCDEVFGEENFICKFLRKVSFGEKTAKPSINKHHDYIICYCVNFTDLIANNLIVGDSRTFENFSNPDNDVNGNWQKDNLLIKVDAGRYGYARYPIHNSYLGITHYPPIYYNEENKKQWHYIEETFKEMERAGKVVYYKTHEEYKGEYSFYIKKYQKDVAKQSKNISTLFAVDNKYTNSNGTRDIARLFGEIGVSFPYPKPSSLMEKIFGHLSICGLTICDHFAGSGTTAHATINLNREDNGHRKYILVEMGEYFDTVMKPRIQKVIYSADWKDGKPVSRKGSSHAFKYIRLESYDDTLDNLEFKSPQIEMTEPIREEYLLSYMLDIESRDSLFSVDKFSKPFSYSMKINGETRNIDLVETFNYLIGLKVDKNYAMKRFDAEFTSEGEYLSVIAKLKNGSTYKIKMVSGTTRDGEKVLVIWRELTGDINKDSAILEAFFKDIQRDKYQKIYVNGDNNLLKLRTDQENWNVMLIEEEFKKRMFEEVK